MEFIEGLSESAFNNLKKYNDELTKTVSKVNEVGNAMKGVNTPSGSDNAIKKLTADYEAQEKTIKKLQNEIQKLIDKQNTDTASKKKQVQAILDQAKSYQSLDAQRQKSINQEAKFYQQQEKLRNKAIADMAKEQAKLEASQNLYNKVQAKLNSLQNEYKGLATKKELGIKLSANEEKSYARLQTSITKYDTTLKAVDATMGKHQRNVGNYASGFNPLSNSINQLTREMPAFANSVQTGFMAISNNLPIFFDAIQQANAEIKLLRANGEATPSLFQKLTSSVLSWGTALSVGVTLLTVFGDNIVDAIFNTKEKAKADEEAKSALEKKNQAEQKYIDTIKDSASEEMSRSQILFESAKNLNLPMKERVKAINELRERYPDYLKNLSNEQILSGQTAAAEERLNDALLKRGIAIALQGKLTEKYNELSAVLLKINNIEQTKGQLDKDAIATAKKLGITTDQLAKNKATISRLTLLNANKEKTAIEAQIDAIFKLYNAYSPYLSAVQENSDAQDKIKDTTEKIAQYQTNSQKAFEANISALEEQLAGIDRMNPAYDMLNGLLQLQKDLYDQLFKSKEKNNQADEVNLENLGAIAIQLDIITKAGEKAKASFEKTQQSIQDYLKTFQSAFFSGAGLPTLFKILNDEIAGFGTNWGVTFNAITEVAQEAFKYIEQASNQRFEVARENLQKEYQVALLFAGESAEAKAEIDRQYEQRQKELKRREFKAKKQQALFNIAVDTAQGVVSALASTPPNIVLSAIIAGIGIAQASVVSAQKMPEYWTGTENAKEGWAWTQERGREFIFDKSGKLKSAGSDKGTTITKMDAGDKVWNAEKTRKALDSMMFNDQLNNILSNNGISSPIVNNRLNDDRIVNALNSVESAINNKSYEGVKLDENGIKKYISNGQTTTYLTNNRRTFTPRNT